MTCTHVQYVIEEIASQLCDWVSNPTRLQVISASWRWQGIYDILYGVRLVETLTEPQDATWSCPQSHVLQQAEYGMWSHRLHVPTSSRAIRAGGSQLSSIDWHRCQTSIRYQDSTINEFKHKSHTRTEVHGLNMLCE